MSSIPENLRVPKGQVTFDAEGNDIESSPYFSRRAHRPPGSSGVTIGRGYDLGHRGTEALIKQEFADSGMVIGPFEGAIGLQGDAAQTWLDANKTGLPIITHEQQKKLFEYTYNSLQKDVVRISSKADVVKKYGATDFDTLNSTILQIVVDLRYRGDYTPSSRNQVQPCMVNNDLDTFKTVMNNKTLWKNVPPDRYKRRVEFIDENAGTTTSTTTANIPTPTPIPAPSSDAPTPDEVAASGTAPMSYKVQPGESLSKLSSKFGVSIDALKAANKNKLKRWGNVEGFNAGDTITIPGNA